jgi:hypothetical protein
MNVSLASNWTATTDPDMDVGVEQQPSFNPVTQDSWYDLEWSFILFKFWLKHFSIIFFRGILDKAFTQKYRQWRDGVHGFNDAIGKAQKHILVKLDICS